MRFYETVFIARQDVTSNQVESLAQQFTNIVKDSGGQVAKTELCGLRQLAYKIKKNKKGHYVLLNYTCPAETVFEMERQMRINEDILRFLTVSVEGLDKNPSPLMQQRSFRDNNNSYDDVDFEPAHKKPAPAAAEATA